MKDTKKWFLSCKQDKFQSLCSVSPVEYLHLSEFLIFFFLLLKTFEWFSPVNVTPNAVYKGGVLLKSRWVILGLRVVPKSKIFQKTTPQKGSDSRKLEYNPEVGREVYFSTWAVFIKNNFLLLYFKNISWHVSFCAAVSLLIFWACGIVGFIFHFFPHLSYRAYTLCFSRTVVFFVMIQW